jgi:molecular chaperone DnaJ
LGAEIEVPTLTGRARLHIEPGTQPGTILRMRDKGIQHLNAHGKGDQLVRINVHIPTKTNAKEKELFKELSASANIAPKQPRNWQKDHSAKATSAA